jgi:hypothetical protein
MTRVFLSYSVKDHHFAALAEAKLGAEQIQVWWDHAQAGLEWRQEIERRIAECQAVLVALSEHSVTSPYVTFEWSYALGKGKPIIPLKLSDCKFHPRLETIQYLDFSVPRALPWESLVSRIEDIESIPDTPVAAPNAGPDASVQKILKSLDQYGWQVMSFDRIRDKLGLHLTDDQFDALIDSHPTIFRKAPIKGGKRGLAKIVP